MKLRPHLAVQLLVMDGEGDVFVICPDLKFSPRTSSLIGMPAEVNAYEGTSVRVVGLAVEVEFHGTLHVSPRRVHVEVDCILIGPYRITCGETKLTRTVNALFENITRYSWRVYGIHGLRIAQLGAVLPTCIEQGFCEYAAELAKRMQQLSSLRERHPALWYVIQQFQ